MTGERGGNVAQGETHGREQDPSYAGEQDPATRAPRPNGPMVQPADPTEASEELGESPDAAYGQREGQADSETDDQPA